MADPDKNYQHPPETITAINAKVREILRLVDGIPVEVAANALVLVAAHACVQSDCSDAHILDMFQEQLTIHRAKRIKEAH
jgi:hypothetical protein